MNSTDIVVLRLFNASLQAERQPPGRDFYRIVLRVVHPPTVEDAASI
jgi:hypothetical protein